MTDELSATLLCVEDDFFTLDEIEVALTHAGYEVLAVGTGAEAMAELRSGRRSSASSPMSNSARGPMAGRSRGKRGSRYRVCRSSI
jgi:CheY-like chemotaxis protein